MNFTAVLSNESESFKDNTNTDFRCQINPPINLQERYEVGLESINFPHAKCLTSNSYYTSIITREGATLDTKIKIENNYYASISDLLSKLKPIKIAEYEKTKKLLMNLAPGMSVSFEKSMAQVLGYKEDVVYEDGKFHHADDTWDLNRYITPILLQTNIVSPNVWRESRLPILKAIYTNGGYLEFAPKYLPLIDNTLDEIHFWFTDKYNKEIEFVDGEVELTLNFRKCSPD